MSGDTPVLDTLADITAASIEHNSLSAREFMLVRLAALIAEDAPPISYIANASAVTEAGLTVEDVQGVMIAVAPVGHDPGDGRRRAHPAGPGHGHRRERGRDGR